MNKLLKNKKLLKLVLLAAVLGLAATPVGRQYASELLPLIEQIKAMDVSEEPAETVEAPEAPEAAK